jgi:predicted MPP superfamily phosphohydrolase
MSRVLTGIVFFSLMMALTGGLHVWMWIRLVRDTRLPSPWGRLLTVALVVLGLSMPVSFLLFRALGRRTLAVVAWPAYVWMGLLLFIFLGLVAGEIIRLFAAVAAGGKVGDPARRLFLSRLLGGGIAAATTGLGAVAAVEGLRQPRLTEITVELPRLPPALDGTTIVQLTDVHVGPTIGRDFIEALVERVNALRPDVVAITGDLVDGSVARLADAVAPLGRIAARFGTYFVTGNHEYYSGVEEWLAELRRLGIRVLRNERVSIGPDGDGGAGFDLAGIDDRSARGMAPGHGPDLARAVAGRDPARALVLLAHQPKSVHEAVRHGVDLQLSGHTHGGQIWPWAFLVRLQQGFVRGLTRVGKTLLYVSCGTGYWGPPMRLGAPSELTRITLRTPKHTA